MTKKEQELIICGDFDKLWYYLWDNNNTNYLNDYNYSKNKYNELIGLNIIKHIIIDNLEKAWIEPEWGFPKGKKDINELDM